MFLPIPVELLDQNKEIFNDSLDYLESLQQLKSLGEVKPKKIADSHDFQIKYKTEICRYWLEHGFCGYGDNCAFAHGITEIRRKPFLPNNYKTKKCKNFHENGYCTYGFRCQFLHNVPRNMTNVKSSIAYFHFYEDLKNYMDESLTNSENQKIQKKRLPAFKDMTETKRKLQKLIWAEKYHQDTNSFASNFILL